MITARLVTIHRELVANITIPVINAPQIVVWNGRYFRLTGSSYGLSSVYTETSAWVALEEKLIKPGMTADTAAAQYEPREIP